MVLPLAELEEARKFIKDEKAVPKKDAPTEFWGLSCGL